ncbi:MAG TPA: adenosine kinase [Xanthobacteraceae bacterium]|nr:adenosine kinase [Xanthobacteraceae bacterium]
MQAAASVRYDVLAIGNAIVDVLARADDDFLIAQGMRKGGMSLIDEARAQAVYDAMGPAVEMSGGSAANTIVGVAGFGGRTAFIGKLKADGLGQAFSHDICAAGVTFTTPPASDGPSTGRCYVLVTPDGERTMNTYLGAAQDLHPRDIDDDMVAASAITYLEGYLWDPEHAKEAFLRAAAIAHATGRKVALSLSDAFCVDRWRDEFLQLMRSRTVDLIFANEAELRSLYQTADFDSALMALRADIDAAAVTRSEKGCLVLSPDGIEAVPAFPVERVVDTTGAGDLFAAGFLYGLARGADDRTCGRLGALAAAEIIQHLGARPEASLKQLARENGLAD